MLFAGCYNNVFLARDNATGEQRAIKLITLTPAQFAVFGNAERVYREVQILRRLKHANIVQMRDLYVAE
jgi:serine/threonine protein kinase